MDDLKVKIFHWGVFLAREETANSKIFVRDLRYGQFSCLSREVDYWALGYNSAREIFRDLLAIPKRDLALVVLHPGNAGSDDYKPFTCPGDLRKIAKGVACGSDYRIGVIVSEEEVNISLLG